MTAALVKIMIAFTIIIVAVIFIEPLKDQINFAKNSDNLDCANASISTGEELTCITTDWTFFFFIGTALAIGVAFIGAKKISQDGGGGA